MAFISGSTPAAALTIMNPESATVAMESGNDAFGHCVPHALPPCPFAGDAWVTDGAWCRAMAAAPGIRDIGDNGGAGRRLAMGATIEPCMTEAGFG